MGPLCLSGIELLGMLDAYEILMVHPCCEWVTAALESVTLNSEGEEESGGLRSRMTGQTVNGGDADWLR